MKIILVPTDFSETAANAVEYAVNISVAAGAKLILFNVFQIPLAPAEAPVIMPMDDLEKTAMKALENLAQDLKRRFGDKLVVEYECACGFVTEEIRSYAISCEADLVVMGMQGGGYLTEKIIGSTTTSLIRKAEFPVLAVDRNAKFTNIKRIVLACDYHEVDSNTVLAPLKEFSSLFKSHIYVLNVIAPGEPAATIEQAVSGIRIGHALESVEHSFHQDVSHDVVRTINEFVETQHIDMMAMIPERHSLLAGFLNEPQTQKMAFHAKVPLLALHS